MGNFYANITVVHCDLDRVADALARARRDAYLHADGGHVVVFPALADEDEIRDLATALAASLRSPAVVALVHDSDILRLAAFGEDGALVDQYDNAPGYFDEEEAAGLPLDDGGMPLPVGGDANVLVGLTGCGDAVRIEAALRREWESYTFAEELHDELARLLGLPVSAVGLDHALLAVGERPDGLGEFRHVAST